LGKELLCLKEKEEIGQAEVHGEEVSKIRDKYPFLKDITLI
jgi:hypothetical protein